MQEETKHNEVIATVTVKKDGRRVKKFVHPADTLVLKMHDWDVHQIRKALSMNRRVVLMDCTGDTGEEEVEICDFFNVMRPDGKLEPCCRALKQFKETFDYSGVKVAIKHKGNIIGESGLRKLQSEAKRYAAQVAARVKAVPRRVVRAVCPRCDYTFDVELSGFEN